MAKTTKKTQKRKVRSFEELTQVADILKFELTQEFQKILGLRVSREVSWEILKMAFITIFKVCKDQGKVRLPHGLGTFTRSESPPFRRKMPKVGYITVPSKTRIRYSAGTFLKNFLGDE